MSTVSAAIFRGLDKLRAFAFGVAMTLWSVSSIHGQCAPLQIDPSKLPNRTTSHQPILPESAYLSDSTYTNEFFGFALELPIAAQGHLVKLPLMPERQHALLAIAYQNGDRSGSLTIDAIEPREGLEGFSAEQQQRQLTTRAPGTIQTGTQSEPQLQPQVGPQGTVELMPQARLAMLQFEAPAERFHLSLRHSGEKYTALYWTQVKNYKLGVLIATNDKEFLRKSKRALAAALFLCTADDGTLATTDGKLVAPEGERYEGPTVPTWRAAAAIQAQPGLKIPPGEVSAGVYRNAALGLQYEVPKGWDVLPAHNSGAPPADLSWLREFEFLHACSRTLLRLGPHSSGDATGSSHQPAILLRALDPACLSMATPASLNDKKTAEEVGASLEALSEFGQVASHDLVSISDRLFMVFRGTIALPAEGAQLAQRMSQTMFATQHNKMLFLWSFMAPTSVELAALPAGGIILDDSQPIELHSALTAK
jgi:hypothetical protein